MNVLRTAMAHGDISLIMIVSIPVAVESKNVEGLSATLADDLEPFGSPLGDEE